LKVKGTKSSWNVKANIHANEIVTIMYHFPFISLIYIFI